MTVARSVLPVFLAGLVIVACGDAAPEDAATDGTPDPALTSSEVTTTYAPVLGVDLSRMTRHESGLYTEDLELGAGDQANSGDSIVVHYTGWLPDGFRFDSSVGADPYTLAIGTGEVIRGWDEGIPGMRVGGKRRLVIPPALAYGAGGVGDVIPPGATLVFDVELVEIR
jgi:FKBP-type peptidyl-prolyl cis-trans isomerase FkpA